MIKKPFGGDFIKKSNKKAGKNIFLIFLAGVFLLFLVFLGVYIYAIRNLDFSADEALFSAEQNKNATRFFYDPRGYSGDDIEKYEPILYASYGGGSEKREWVDFDSVSEYLKDGFVAIEDREFWSHDGVNLKRTFGAFLNYVLKKDASFGASTITQQVVKNISGDNEKSAKRKIEELLRAYHLEKKYTKEEIFELYINIIPMGENIYGVGAASRVYFGKEASDLTAYEAATLIGITNAPTRYNPRREEEACLKKRNSILLVMYNEGIVDMQEYEDAIDKPLGVLPKDKSKEELNSWFVESVCDEVCEDLMTRCGYSYSAARLLIANGGLSVYTTIDPQVQGILEKYFENARNFPDDISRGLQFSMVIADSENAVLRGIVGGVGKKSANRVLNYATSNVTPGSVLKPLALYAPLIEEREITWSSVFDDVPVSFKKNNEGGYEEFPRNSPAVYDGLVTVADALAQSKNTVAVKLYEKLGAEKIYNNLYKNYGFNSLVRKEKNASGGTVTDLDVAPLALGQLSYGVDLRSLTEAYTVFPNEGELFRGRSYLFLLDSNGTCILNNAAKSERVLSKESARVMNQMLSRVVSVGTAKRITIGEIVDVAGKTGTSGGSKDKLFIGYTPYFTAGIWCGYPDSSQAVPNYSKNHLNVWDAVMREIHEGLSIDEDEERFFSTLGLDYLPFCKDSGKLYTPICTKDVRGERLGYGYFIKGTYSNEMCDRHILCEYNLWQGDLYKEENRSEQKNFIALLKLPDRIFPKEIDVADSKYAYCKDTKESETEENKNHFFEEHRKKKQKRGLFWKRKQF